MINTSNDNDMYDLFISGQNNEINIIKALIYKKHKTIFNKIDFDNNYAFSEPYIFGYFTIRNIEIPIEQLMYGYYKHNTDTSLTIKTDKNGMFYIPNIGLFKTNSKTSKKQITTKNLTSSLNTPKEDIILLNENTHIKYTQCEPMQHIDEIMMHFIKGGTKKESYVNYLKKNNTYSKHATLALQTIINNSNSFYKYLKPALRRIVFFSSDTMNSFSNISLHGTIFVNMSQGQGEIYLLEDITHQCAHVIFDSITFNKNKFINIDHETPLNTYNGDANDKRSIYTTYHALYTYYCITQIFDDCITNNIYTGSCSLELHGRLSYVLKKYTKDIENLDHIDIFTELGWGMYKEFRDHLATMLNKYQHLVSELNHNNQPYVFSLKNFIEINRNSDCYHNIIMESV